MAGSSQIDAGECGEKRHQDLLAERGSNGSRQTRVSPTSDAATTCRYTPRPTRKAKLRKNKQAFI